VWGRVVVQSWICISDRETRNAYRSLVKKPLEKQCLGRPIRKQKDNMKMECREIGCEDGRRMELAQEWV
jgi:hypothetical protein